MELYNFSSFGRLNGSGYLITLTKLDARQAQPGQQQLEPGGVDGVRGCHAAASRLKAGPAAQTAASSS